MREYLEMQDEGTLGAIMKDARATFLLGELCGSAMRYAETVTGGGVQQHGPAMVNVLRVARALGEYLRSVR